MAVREERQRRMLVREEERSTGVGVGWERRRKLCRGPEKEEVEENGPQPKLAENGSVSRERHCRPRWAALPPCQFCRNYAETL